MDTLYKRFISKVEKTDTCWLWRGHTNGVYGKIRGIGGRDSRSLFAHRVSYELFVGKIPYGKIIMHKCDNPICVNPSHLSVGTHKENTIDMIAKGRRILPTPNPPYGERHPFAKMTDKQVELAREEYKGLRGQQKEIAAKYGVSPVTMNKILNMKSRKKPYEG